MVRSKRKFLLLIVTPFFLNVGCGNVDTDLPGSNPPPCHWMDLCFLVPDLAPPRFLNNVANWSASRQ